MSTTTPDDHYTRCPQCATIFRVTAAQLGARDGRVRCGQCRAVFDANENALSPAAFLEEKDSDASIPVSTSDEPATMDSPVDSSSAIALAQTQGEVAPVSAQQADVAMAMAKRAPRWTVLFALAIPVLVLLLVAQAVFHFRDTIASRWPQTSPALTRMCEVAGCSLRPLHEIGYLSIEASDLQADPAHKGLLILTATVRNRAPYALAYPYLELTLTDSHDQPVIRRALAPKEYAGGTTDIDAGIAGNAELTVKLFIDASASTQVGYRVYLFYP